MTILLPPLERRVKGINGYIIKQILRFQSIVASRTVQQKHNITYYVFKHAGNEYLVLFENTSNALLKEYRYVLKQRLEGVVETNDKLNLSDFTWEKHPLLTTGAYNRYTKAAVLDSWKDAFTLRTELEDGAGLRIPQVGALYAIQAHWTISKEAGIVVLPTGTGKTDTMIACMVMSKMQTLLVIVPTDPLRDQLTDKILSLGVLPLFGLVNDNCESPIVGQLKHKFSTASEVENFFDQVNVVVATMSVIATCAPDIQLMIAAKSSHLFIDEAHHTPADTWRSFKKLFTHAKMILFTATPFRNDGRRLEGKIIFNFPLKRAQELDYFRPIHFKPVHEYNYHEADRLIAQTAISQLQADLKAGYDHVLMVRVNTINRGLEIFPLYEVYNEFSPVLIHSQIKPKRVLKETIKQVIQRKHRIIICVDMLGEGFDLPELKIAAFHDTKKSLTITLQLAGRFTRVKPHLGPATFIANIADPAVHEDLEDLYYRDSDWNILLPDLSYKMSLEQEDFRMFLEGFRGFPDKFPIQAIKHPLSTIIFKAPTTQWKPLSYRNGIRGIDNFEYTYSDYNPEFEILIIIVGKRSAVKWARVQDFESVDWDIIICYFDKVTQLLYLHASNTSSYYLTFVQAICENAILIKGQIIFRCFHNISRIRLHNVGVREPLGRAINFIMRVGSDIKTALRDTEIKKAIKSNIFGVGFENGSRISLGCSHNGRVWAMRTNDILTWVGWCKSVAKKITDETINPDTVLKGTLIPQEIITIPEALAFEIEWPDIIFRDGIGGYDLEIENETYPIWNCDIVLRNQSKSVIMFEIQLPSGNHSFQLRLILRDEIKQYEIESNSTLQIKEGVNIRPLTTFFMKYPPLIYFVDGSFLEGNLFTKVHHVIPEFAIDQFIIHNWEGVNLKKESQTYKKIEDSIQFRLIQKLLADGKYILLMDDDDKGEIADVLGFRVYEDQNLLIIDAYHCKYSSENIPGMRLSDFYEVCGQAQRSIKWMEDAEEIFKHLGRRSQERFKRTGINRFEVGDENVLDVLKRRAKKDLKVKMNVFIVQPGLSFSGYDLNSDVSKLLAVVQTYLKETWNADLHVIASE